MLSFRSRRTALSFILGATLLLGVGTILVMRDHSPKPPIEPTKLAATATTNSTPAAETPVLLSSQTPAANKNIEKIPELGASLTVADSIKDLTYTTNTVTLKNGQTATLVMFSTASLTQLDTDCSAATGPLGSLEKVNGQYPSDDPYAAVDYGRLVKQFATFYIASGSPQAACSTNSTTQAVENSHKSDFVGASSTLQQAN